MSRKSNPDGAPKKKGHKLLLVVVIVAIIAVVGACASGGSGSKSSDKGGESATATSGSKSTKKSSSDSSDDTKINADKFKKIENGMSYEQVKQIIGSDGTEQTTNQVGDITTTIYEWKSDGFGVANVTFQNDQVVNKAQFGVNDQSAAKATMDKYNQVQTGMTYDQVKDIMGGDGELQSDTKISGHTSQLYNWTGESVGSSASITFTDGSVSSKAQYGLDG
jgi:outer membrane protein assembly factor BamE (lipoprotein component of BamABCDE complex)